MPLRILLLGDGGREHALALKLAESPLVASIVISLGNSGTSQVPRTFNIKSRSHEVTFADIGQLARANDINLVIPT